MADRSDDQNLRHSLARAQGQFVYGPMSVGGHVNQTSKKTEGEDYFGKSVDMTPSVDHNRFQLPRETRRSNQRHLKTMSVASDD